MQTSSPEHHLSTSTQIVQPVMRTALSSTITLPNSIKEVWLPIIEYENIYDVSSFGRIRNRLRNRMMKQSKNVAGYMYVGLSKKGKQTRFYTSRLVATAFVPNPHEYKTVDHIDRNRANNHVSNLKWASPKQQCQNRKHCSVGRATCTVTRHDPVTGSLLETYVSTSEAVRWCVRQKLTTAPHCSVNIKIGDACKDKLKTAYGFAWQKPDAADKPGEIWKRVTDLFPDAHAYEVSTFGRIKKSKTNRILRGTLSHGYTVVRLTAQSNRAKAFRVNRLVAYTFFNTKDLTLVVNHKNLDKADNRLDNLEICTQKQKCTHALQEGTHKFARPVVMRFKNAVPDNCRFASVRCAAKRLSLDDRIIHRQLRKYAKYETNEVIVTYETPDPEFEPFVHPDSATATAIPGEIWRCVSSIFPGFCDYAVSNQGRVKNIKTDRLLKGAQHCRHIRVNLKNNITHKTRHLGVRRLVAFTFYDVTDLSLDVCHINQNTADNRLENLEICASLQMKQTVEKQRPNNT